MLRQATSVGSTEAVFHAIAKEQLIANDTQLAIEDRLTRNKTRRFWLGGFDRIRGYWLGVRRDIATIGRDQKSWSPCYGCNQGPRSGGIARICLAC